jgi:ribonuclease HII
MKGLSGLIGVDEAGRGALAGPVVAAAVAARSDFYDTEWCKRNASRINDS